MINHRSCYGQFFSFFFFFFNDGITGTGEKIVLLFTYRKIVIFFNSVVLEHTPSSFPQLKRWSAIVRSKKKKKKKSTLDLVDNSCFFAHNGITTQKTTRESQESTTKTRLRLAWPPKFQNQALFTPRAQNRFLFLDYFDAVAGRNLDPWLPAWKSSSPWYAHVQRSGLLLDLRGLLWRGYTGFIDNRQPSCQRHQILYMHGS